MTLADAATAVAERFSADALRNAANVAMDAARATAPSDLLLLAFICDELAERWDGPVTTAEADVMRERYAHDIASALTAAGSGDIQRVHAHLESLSKVFLSG